MDADTQSDEFDISYMRLRNMKLEPDRKCCVRAIFTARRQFTSFFFFSSSCSICFVERFISCANWFFNETRMALSNQRTSNVIYSFFSLYLIVYSSQRRLVEPQQSQNISMSNCQIEKAWVLRTYVLDVSSSSLSSSQSYDYIVVAFLGYT